MATLQEAVDLAQSLNDRHDNFLSEKDAIFQDKVAGFDNYLVGVSGKFAVNERAGWLDISVGGDVDKWYPVVFEDPKGSVTRVNRHTHQQNELYGMWNGGFSFSVRAMDTNYGGTRSYVLVDEYLEMSRVGAQFVANATADSFFLILMLRGATDYTVWNSAGIEPVIYLEETVIGQANQTVSSIAAVDVSMPSVGYVRGD